MILCYHSRGMDSKLRTLTKRLVGLHREDRQLQQVGTTILAQEGSLDHTPLTLKLTIRHRMKLAQRSDRHLVVRTLFFLWYPWMTLKALGIRFIPKSEIRSTKTQPQKRRKKHSMLLLWMPIWQIKKSKVREPGTRRSVRGFQHQRQWRIHMPWG